MKIFENLNLLPVKWSKKVHCGQKSDHHCKRKMLMGKGDDQQIHDWDPHSQRVGDFHRNFKTQSTS